MPIGWQFPINPSAKPSCQLIDLHTTNITSILLVGASWFLIPPPRRLSELLTLMLQLMTSPSWGCLTSLSRIDEWLVVVWTACHYRATLKSFSLGAFGSALREENPTTQSLRLALVMPVLLLLLSWMRWLFFFFLVPVYCARVVKLMLHITYS